MKVVLATRNRDKIAEIAAILDGVAVDVKTVFGEFENAPETVEDGATLEENALKKARSLRDHTGLCALADDTGLFVEALGGAPGIYAARYAGPSATYADNCDKLLAEMHGVPDALRRAEFRTAVALALVPEAAQRAGVDGDALVCEGILHGRIATVAVGRGGFGYDPIFFVEDAGRTLAEMSAAEKNAGSHRYRALLEIKELMLRMHLLEDRS